MMMMMNGRGSSSSSSCSNRYPFTATQWQELEHQALIFKYMASGIPIPSDLILPIRRSFLLDPSPCTTPSLAFPHQLPMGWGSYQLGYGRKAEDPEPGRCRRTDGKKWRCSKEAYPDSKYCERHMHRGKNRSRKPVEMSLASIPTTHHSLYPTPPPPPPPSLSISTPDSSHNLFYPYSSSSSSSSSKTSSTSTASTTTTTTTRLHLDTGSYYSTENKDYRYGHGMKDVDEYSFFSESSGASRDDSWPKLSSNYSNCTADFLSKEEGEKQQQQHCFVLGADFKLEKPVKVDREEVPLRHFFDEWPQKSKDSSSWMSLDDHSSSRTQLSISIPTMASIYHNEG
ncbi:Growth-regulating factor protein [Dioscorea alata]|uniref:Growth-regulating factor protein n=1 Tax=Dioscorea alata TaxID=55571 RepID=A0ACB7U8N4_DIOAL|nr:Growth-regulating factor protein [Dioscorea alata]